MDTESRRWIILLIGPPGAGKGTQAELLAEDFGLYNFETSRIIEEKFAAADPEDPVMRHEQEIFKAGKLNTPELVRSWVMEKIAELAARGSGIVFSGSPRTLFEAEGEIPLFEKLYGRQNIKTVHLDISEREAIYRNSNRRLCKANRHPIPFLPEFRNLAACPKDGSELIKRVLDNEGTMRVRYETYLKDTAPVLDFLAASGYAVVEINGDRPIQDVHDAIVSRLHKSHASDHHTILNRAESL